MATLPRFDSICCGAVGTTPSHRAGCRFEIAAEIQRSGPARRARQVLDAYQDPGRVVTFNQIASALDGLSRAIDSYATGHQA